MFCAEDVAAPDPADPRSYAIWYQPAQTDIAIWYILADAAQQVCEGQCRGSDGSCQRQQQAHWAAESYLLSFKKLMVLHRGPAGDAAWLLP